MNAPGHDRTRFAFSTGIEGSYPIVHRSDGSSQRMDQFERTYHYRYFREDLQLVQGLGLQYLRYGPPYYKVHLGPGKYDWEFADVSFAEVRRLGLVPIADLCHFGAPDWIGSFQNPEWPELFAEYALAFARRFPWVQFYTPVNEIYVCAKLSALSGFWNEALVDDDRAFVALIKHLCEANLLAMKAILSVRSDAVFIQSESTEYFHLGADDPETIQRAHWENERRFISLDLLYSHSPCSEVCFYLMDNGMSREEIEAFMRHGLDRHIILGTDFYQRNEQVVQAGGGIEPAGEVFGWSIITGDYYERYRRPIMHTETNVRDATEAPRWLWKKFLNVMRLRSRGIPVLGFTWYSLLDQIDWNDAMADPIGVVNPLGLYDLQRRPRPVAATFRKLLEQFSHESLVPNAPYLGFA